MPWWNSKRFSDGSEVQHLSRDAVRYKEGAFELDIWLDWGPGLLFADRILNLTELEKGWTKFPNTDGRLIEHRKKEEIIEKLRAYLGTRRKLTVVDNVRSSETPTSN